MCFTIFFIPALTGALISEPIGCIRDSEYPGALNPEPSQFQGWRSLRIATCLLFPLNDDDCIDIAKKVYVVFIYVDVIARGWDY